ncbi:hypothetical protein [Tenacibaculum sp. SG-28]|uniref:hypothetical protein n=1 Tax=Tenacibaculum sp. SG-28 TaxID=754426 RepID=UPI000CF5699B|nr:hypothetical protein [Tenacibaculum sp. SG-28]PQJ23221.1 hypothetical protein BSU00_03070 [Tenacibaculum sp. SG-28]
MTDLKLNLKKIDPVRYALIIGLLMALMTFVIITIAMLFGSLFGPMLQATESDTSGFGMILGGGFIMLLIVPVVYFIFGFIFGFIATTVLNFILKKTGGLPLHFEKTEITTLQNQ